MDSELFEHHLSSPRGRGKVPGEGASGVAGTRACGDVIRFGLTLSPDGAHVADAGWEADACGATLVAASAAVELVSGRPLLDVARIGARELAQEIGGLSAGKFHAAELVADALARALGTAAFEGARLATADRTLVAMSGGVDSAVAALLCARGGDDEVGGDVVAVTLELWADEQNDAERSCCSASAVRLARGLAHRMQLPHFTLDLREQFRAGVVEPFLAEWGAGLTPNPCIRCNGNVRLDAMLELAERLGAGALATGHYARVVEADDPDGPLLAAAADAWKDQTYMLAALQPDSLARMRFPLGGLTKPRVRELAAEAELPVASRSRLAGPLLPRRHEPRRVPRPARWDRRAAGGDRGCRRAGHRPPPRAPRLHRRTAQRAGRRVERTALRARHRCAHEPRHSGHARAARDDPRARPRGAPAA